MTKIKKIPEFFEQFFESFITLTILYLEECQTAATQHLP